MNASAPSQLFGGSVTRIHGVGIGGMGLAIGLAVGGINAAIEMSTGDDLGGHAMTAITAITAQNTLGVTAVHPVPTEIVLAQIDAVVSDIGVDAIKIAEVFF